MENEKEKSKELINLNFKIIDVVKIDELEERLELSAAWLCNDCTTQYGCMCYSNDFDHCQPTNNIQW